MPPVLRAEPYGTARIPATLLTDIDWTLDMDTAAPRSVVAPLAAQLRVYDRDLTKDAEIEETHVHDWMYVGEVDAVQRLRGWHRLRHGTISVAAAGLARVRNVLDGLTFVFEAECEDEGVTDPLESCNLCRFCKILLLRDRIDALMDAQGFYGGSYYEAYGRDGSAADAEDTWRSLYAAA